MDWLMLMSFSHLKMRILLEIRFIKITNHCNNCGQRNSAPSNNGRCNNRNGHGKSQCSSREGQSKHQRWPPFSSHKHWWAFPPWVAPGHHVSTNRQLIGRIILQLIASQDFLVPSLNKIWQSR